MNRDKIYDLSVKIKNNDFSDLNKNELDFILENSPMTIRSQNVLEQINFTLSDEQFFKLIGNNLSLIESNLKYYNKGVVNPALMVKITEIIANNDYSKGFGYPNFKLSNLNINKSLFSDTKVKSAIRKLFNFKEAIQDPYYEADKKKKSIDDLQFLLDFLFEKTYSTLADDKALAWSDPSLHEMNNREYAMNEFYENYDSKEEADVELKRQSDINEYINTFLESLLKENAYLFNYISDRKYLNTDLLDIVQYRHREISLQAIPKPFQEKHLKTVKKIVMRDIREIIFINDDLIDEEMIKEALSKDSYQDEYVKPVVKIMNHMKNNPDLFNTWNTQTLINKYNSAPSDSRKNEFKMMLGLIPANSISTSQLDTLVKIDGVVESFISSKFDFKTFFENNDETFISDEALTQFVKTNKLYVQANMYDYLPTRLKTFVDEYHFIDSEAIELNPHLIFEMDKEKLTKEIIDIAFKSEKSKKIIYGLKNKDLLLFFDFSLLNNEQAETLSSDISDIFSLSESHMYKDDYKKGLLEKMYQASSFKNSKSFNQMLVSYNNDLSINGHFLKDDEFVLRSFLNNPNLDSDSLADLSKTKSKRNKTRNHI